MPHISIYFNTALILLLAGAALQDMRFRQISNGWPLAIVLLFVPGFLFGALPGPLWSHCVHFALALAAGMGLFAPGWFGGGDAKLYAAVALWFPLGTALYLLVSVTLAGAVMALMLIGRALVRSGEARQLARTRQGKVAYGVAIAAGTTFSIGLTLLGGGI